MSGMLTPNEPCLMKVGLVVALEKKKKSSFSHEFMYALMTQTTTKTSTQHPPSSHHTLMYDHRPETPHDGFTSLAKINPNQVSPPPGGTNGAHGGDGDATKRLHTINSNTMKSQKTVRQKEEKEKSGRHNNSKDQSCHLSWATHGGRTDVLIQRGVKERIHPSIRFCLRSSILG